MGKWDVILNTIVAMLVLLFEIIIFFFGVEWY
jgi:hypothetical protein